ncbi:MAG: thioredoxin family protein [Planctomycetota bacterium]
MIPLSHLVASRVVTVSIALAPGLLAMPQVEGRPATPWHPSLDAAMVAAQRDARPILIYFWAEGSEQCRAFYAETLTAAAAAEELAHFECVSASAEQQLAHDLIRRFGVKSLPTVVFVDARGEAEDAIRGRIDLPGFLAQAQRVRRGEGTVRHWRELAAAAPDDLDVRLTLATQLEHVGRVAESAELEASIKAADPDGQTVAGAQLQLYDVFAAIRAGEGDPSLPGTWDLTPLYEHLSHIKPRAVRYEAWYWIIDVERQRGDRTKERAALAGAWRHATDRSKRATLGFRLIRRYHESDVELVEADKHLAQEVLEDLHRLAKEHDQLSTRAYVLHAEALVHALWGRGAAALAAAAKAAEVDPDEPIHRELVDALGGADR